MWDILPHTLCVATGLAATTNPTGVLGAVSPPAVEASGSAPIAYPTAHTLRMSTDRVKSAECPTNVKEVVARFVLWVYGEQLRAVLDYVVLAEYRCRYDWREHHVKEIR